MQTDSLVSAPRESGRRGYTGRQHELLDALESVFLEEGFSHLTIGELVARMRCSRRTIYSLAPSREELILIVVDRLLTRLGVEASAAAKAQSDPWQAIEAYLERAVTTLVRATPAFNEDVESYLPTRHLYASHLNVALKVLSDLVASGVASGFFREVHPRLMAEILVYAAERIRRPDVLERSGISGQEALREFGTFMRNGLLAAPEGVD
jgi:AcrR family transcriptional regulator